MRERERCWHPVARYPLGPPPPNFKKVFSNHQWEGWVGQFSQCLTLAHLTHLFALLPGPDHLNSGSSAWWGCHSSMYDCHITGIICHTAVFVEGLEDGWGGTFSRSHRPLRLDWWWRPGRGPSPWWYTSCGIPTPERPTWIHHSLPIFNQVFQAGLQYLWLIWAYVLSIGVFNPQ